MPTVLDVARQARVSSATVSRVLNGHTSVDPAMRERVESAVATLAYRPNPLAQGLRKRQSKTVALLVGDIGQRHLAELTMRIQVALEAQGLDLLLVNLGHSPARLASSLERAARLRLRAVVLTLSDVVPASVVSHLQALQEQDVHLVCVGQDLTRWGVDSIVHEERAAAHRSVSYLIDQGQRRIAYVGRIKGSAIGTQRFQGYRAALRRARLFDPALVWDRAFRFAAGRDAVLQALDQELHFTALQAGSDEMAAGALSGLQDRGLRVPQDVAVVGFGDVEMGAFLRPALTTVSTHPDLAARRLSEWLTTPSLPGSTARMDLLERHLVIRDSA